MWINTAPPSGPHCKLKGVVERREAYLRLNDQTHPCSAVSHNSIITEYSFHKLYSRTTNNTQDDEVFSQKGATKSDEAV